VIEARIAEGILRTAERIERLAKSLNPQGQAPQEIPEGKRPPPFHIDPPATT
jgi:hypothetical protein